VNDIVQPNCDVPLIIHSLTHSLTHQSPDWLGRCVQNNL